MTLVEILTARICPYCGKRPLLVDSEVIYGTGKNFGKLWACMACNAWVGCHKGTTKPLGRLANDELRKCKVEAHAWFDPLWKKKEKQGFSRMEARNQAYIWLAFEMQIDRDICHIGMFDADQCKKAIEICQRYYRHIHTESPTTARNFKNSNQ